MESKTHYRKVYKSDHLGSADLEEMTEEGKRLVFTIDHVKQQYGAKVAGRKIDGNIAYFKENIKPMVLNATNAKQIADFAKSKFVEEWNSIIVELYVDPNVSFGGERVGGVRIKTTQPQLSKPELTPDHKSWTAAKDAFAKGNATPESIRKNWNLSKENELQLAS
jgi:hypothetical protein